VAGSLINNVRVSNIDSISNCDVVVGLDIMEIVDSKLNTSYMSPILRKNWIVFDLLSSPLCYIAFSGDSVSFSNLLVLLGDEYTDVMLSNTLCTNVIGYISTIELSLVMSILVNVVISMNVVLLLSYVVSDALVNGVKDSCIREYSSTYDILTLVILLLFCIMILSESLFFLPFFWASFHATCSSM